MIEILLRAIQKCMHETRSGCSLRRRRIKGADLGKGARTTNGYPMPRVLVVLDQSGQMQMAQDTQSPSLLTECYDQWP